MIGLDFREGSITTLADATATLVPLVAVSDSGTTVIEDGCKGRYNWVVGLLGDRMVVPAGAELSKVHLYRMV